MLTDLSTLIPQTTNCSAFVGKPSYGSLLLSGFALFGVVGNGLVCLAIVLEKKLQNATNIFLLSLAIADLMVSLIVMPCAILSELNYGKDKE